MAAEIPALRAALIRVGLNGAAADAFMADDGGGLNTIASFADLTPSETTELCRTIRRPGGEGQAAAGAQPQPNLGHAVSFRAETNLKLMVYYLRHRLRTSRALAAADVTIDNISALKPRKDFEKDHEDADPPKINPRNWPKTIEGLEEWLRNCLGVSKVPLAYVIREDIAVPAADPADGYPDVHTELIARAPIRRDDDTYHPNYLIDRTTVWTKLAELCRDEDCYTYLRSAQRSRDGRAAFTTLRNQYLGPNHVTNLAAKAQRALEDYKYRGEGRHHNFDSYIRHQTEQHIILNSLTRHGYSGIDERTKVRHLLDNIDTAALNAPVENVSANQDLLGDYDAAAGYIRDFLERTKRTTRRSANISSVYTSTPRRDGGALTQEQIDSADMTVPDRYYTKAEYGELSPQQKIGLKLKRDQRGHEPGAADSAAPPAKRARHDNHAINRSALSRAVAAITANLQALTDYAGGDANDNNNSSGSTPTSATAETEVMSNRTNPALQRRE